MIPNAIFYPLVLALIVFGTWRAFFLGRRTQGKQKSYHLLVGVIWMVAGVVLLVLRVWGQRTQP